MKKRQQFSVKNRIHSCKNKQMKVLYKNTQITRKPTALLSTTFAKRICNSGIYGPRTLYSWSIYIPLTDDVTKKKIERHRSYWLRRVAKMLCNISSRAFSRVNQPADIFEIQNISSPVYSFPDFDRISAGN